MKSQIYDSLDPKDKEYVDDFIERLSTGKIKKDVLKNSSKQFDEVESDKNIDDLLKSEIGEIIREEYCTE